MCTTGYAEAASGTGSVADVSGGPRDSSVVIPKNVGEHRFPEKL